MDNQIRIWAKKIWSYHQMNHQLSKADAILVLCSHDKLVAERGAQLFLDGWSPLLIFSGGLGAITKDLWTVPEADQFAEIALKMNVPAKDILIENRSTNTGENILFRSEERRVGKERRAWCVRTRYRITNRNTVLRQ